MSCALWRRSLRGLAPDGPCLFTLDDDSDRPDEAEQFPRDGCHHLLLALATPQEPAVAAMEPVLGFPRDLLHRLTLCRLTLTQGRADLRSMPIRPGRLHDNAAQMRI